MTNSDYRCNLNIFTNVIQLEGGNQMTKLPQISEAEYEVMKVIWEKGEVKSSEIIEVLTMQTDWKPKTIQTLITRLVVKGIVESEKGDGKAYIYYPCVKEGDYKREVGRSFLQRIYNGSVKMMMMNFLKEQKLSQDEIEELKALLDEKEVD